MTSRIQLIRSLLKSTLKENEIDNINIDNSEENYDNDATWTMDRKIETAKAYENKIKDLIKAVKSDFYNFFLKMQEYGFNTYQDFYKAEMKPQALESLRTSIRIKYNNLLIARNKYYMILDVIKKMADNGSTAKTKNNKNFVVDYDKFTNEINELEKISNGIKSGTLSLKDLKAFKSEKWIDPDGINFDQINKKSNMLNSLAYQAKHDYKK